MSDATPASPAALAEAPWRAGVRAARANAVPGAVLSVFAVALLLGYRYVPTIHAALDGVADFKERWGLGFAAISTALFGGLVPGLVQRLRPATRRAASWRAIGFISAVWAVKGVEIDLLYRLQALALGHGADPATVAAKVFFDMGVYCPTWAVPSTIAAYAVMEAGVSLKGLAPMKILGLWGWYKQIALPIIISNWGVWVPAVCVIYTLPLALQLPVQNLVLCFWSLMLVLQVRDGGGPHVEAPDPPTTATRPGNVRRPGDHPIDPPS